MTNMRSFSSLASLPGTTTEYLIRADHDVLWEINEGLGGAYASSVNIARQ